MSPHPHTWTRLILASFFLLALAIRLDDLTDLPLDYHPTRQLWSALIARGMYYQAASSNSSSTTESNPIPSWKQQMAILQWKSKAVLEPRLMETLAAASYLVVKNDTLWIPRLYSALFWLLGGIPLFLLAKGFSNAYGGLTVTVLYLFLPYAVIASRSFQPEPLMVAAMIFALWSLFRWQQVHSWHQACLAGLLLCLVIFIKALVLFPLMGGMLGLFVSSRGFKKAWRDPQVWGIALVAILPNLIYTYYGTYIAGFLEGNLNGRFFPELLLNPWFYIRWELKIHQIMSHALLALSLFGVLFYRNRFANAKVHRWMLGGLWLGYVIYGLLFNYQISTHDYYHLPLIPIAVLSLSPMAASLFSRLLALGRWARPIILCVAIAILGLLIWRAHAILHTSDYRGEAAKYAKIESKLGRKYKIIALTEDYGYRLAYWGWINARIWPSYGDLNYQQKLRQTPTPEFRKIFSRQTAGMDYFLITWFEELEYQPELKGLLFENYPIYERGEGYLIFDLKHRLGVYPDLGSYHLAHNDAWLPIVAP